MKFVGVLMMVLLCTQLEYSMSQDCGLTHTLASTGFTAIDVNITDTPSCFVCPATAVYFSLNGVTLTNAPPDVVIDSTTVSIYNWSAVPLMLPTVNMIVCTGSVGFTYRTFFFSLTPGPLALQGAELFYFEGTNTISVECLNLNRRPGYNLQHEVWMNSAGEVVGSGRTLNLTATRGNAGSYTCTVPTVPLIPPMLFEVVIYYPPEIYVMIDSSLKINANGTLRLDCRYSGSPTPNITWLLNGTKVYTLSSATTIITSLTQSGMISQLIWNNVPQEASGFYECIAENAFGRQSANFSVRVGNFFTNTVRISSSCPSSEAVEGIKEDILQYLSLNFGVSLLGLLRQHPADSCNEIFRANPYSNEGLYWIRSNSNIEQQGCSFA